MTSLRLTVTYWPALYIGKRVRPALALHRTPDPHCPDCDGCGYTAYEIDCADEAPCHCTPEQPLVALPLPRAVGRAVMRYWRAQARPRFTCWFCGADNPKSAGNRCGFCSHDQRR
jgi:hypothetical protein